MEKFWAVILIFVIVAAGGLLYVNQVYNPQKETQMAMAEVANQTLSAVKAEIENGAGATNVDADDVIQEVKDTCDSDNTVEIIVTTSNGEQHTYLTTSAGIDNVISEDSGQFRRVPYSVGGELKKIEFTAIAG